MNAPTSPAKLQPKDFASDQEIRWCPGCGDYAIIKSVHRALADIGAEPANTVFISGIGCAARFPYYMSTYGFHTIHGRAPAIATGVKLANPDLNIWIVSGDGDSLSIGGNHLLHLLRRNVDVNFLLFNNEIYGLTKGQYSPTSKTGTRSPSTPAGSLDRPVSACRFALGAGARFVARCADTDQKALPGYFARAQANRGTSFVEVLQNCIVYNDGAFGHITDKAVAADSQIHLVNGKPLVFGKDRDKGIRLKPGKFAVEVVKLGVGGASEDDLLVHDESDSVLAGMLAAMEPPHFPVAVGFIYCDPAESLGAAMEQHLAAMRAKDPDPDLNALLRGGHTWTVT